MTVLMISGRLAFCPAGQHHHREWLAIYDFEALFVTQASLAQLVERGTSNAEVTGSTPLGGSVFCVFFFALCQMHMVSFCFDLASRNALQDCLMVLLRSNEDKACELVKRRS